MDPAAGAARTAVIGTHDQRGFPRRYWRALREYSSRELQEDFSLDPAAFLFPSVLVGGVLVAGLHFLQAATLGRATWVGLLGLFPSVATAALSLILLGWLYWQIRLDSSRVEPYLWVVLVSALTIGACSEAFAGAATFLWQHGVLKPAPAGQASLWTSERFFGWHLLDAVPFLSVPATLRWTEPSAFADRVTGSLLLVYTVLLIVPLLRIGFAGYQFLAGWWLTQRDRDKELHQRWHTGIRPPWMISAGSTLPGQAFGVVAGAVTAYLALLFVSDPTAIVSRWLNPRIARGITLLGHHLGLSWARTAPQWAAVVLVLWILSDVVEDLDLAPVVDAPSLPRLAAASIMFAALVALATMAFAATTVLLVQLGWGVPHPTVEGAREVPVAIGFYVWHGLNAVPGLNITAALHLSLQHELIDRWDGALLLAYKAVFLGLLFLPIAIAVRALYRNRRAPTASAAIWAWAEFGERLRKCLAQLDGVEGMIKHPARVTDTDRILALAEAEDRVDELDDGLRGVTALFGPGEVVERARVAIQAAADWAVALRRFEYARRAPTAGGLRVDLSRLRRTPDEKSFDEELKDRRVAASEASAVYMTVGQAALRKAAARR